MCVCVFLYLCQVFVKRIYNQLLVFFDHGHELLELSLAKPFRHRHPRVKRWAQPVHYLTVSVHPFTRKTHTHRQASTCTHTHTHIKKFISCMSFTSPATRGSDKIKTRSTTLLFFFTEGRCQLWKGQNEWRVGGNKVCSLQKKTKNNPPLSLHFNWSVPWTKCSSAAWFFDRTW